MAEPVAGQVMLFIYTILTGVLAGVIYDCYAGLGNVLRLRKAAIHIGDILFWLVLTALVYTLLWYYNQGEVRFFVLVGLGMGAGLYHRFCRPVVRRLIIAGWTHTFRLLRRLVRALLWLLAVFFFPLRIIFLVLSFPFRLIGAALRKICGVPAIVLKKIVPVPVKKFYRRLAAPWREISLALKRKR